MRVPRSTHLLAAVCGLLLGMGLTMPEDSQNPFGLVGSAHADDDGGGDDGGGGGGGGGGGSSGEGGGESRRFQAGRQMRLSLPFGQFRLGWPFQQQRPPRAAKMRNPRPAGMIAPPSPERELVIADLSGSERAAIIADGFNIIAERPLSSGRGLVARLAPPPRLSMSRALARLREIAPSRPIDRNTVYAQRYRIQGGKPASRKVFSDPLAAVDGSSSRHCSNVGTIGVIDTGIDANHPAFRGKLLETAVIRPEDRTASSQRHGTAIVAILLGDGSFPGLAQQAKVIAVDAFHAKGGSDQVDTYGLVSAMDMLQDRNVAVINLSLTGDANEVLDAEGKRAAARGIVVVAAGGNDGAAARPRYPAAYGWAIAVTAVDEARDVYRRAIRGPHIRLAAPGVSLELRDGGGQVRHYTGTSFAVPFVAARVALGQSERRAELDTGSTATAIGTGQGPQHGASRIGQLLAQAIDLGAPGRDDTYGHGLVQFSGACSAPPPL